jgi:hypothetical protein
MQIIVFSHRLRDDTNYIQYSEYFKSQKDRRTNIIDTVFDSV